MYPDPEGGLFVGAAARKLAGEDGFLPIPALRQPGWKVSFNGGWRSFTRDISLETLYNDSAGTVSSTSPP